MEKVTIVGGGNGHSVAMSQYGAKELTKRDYDYREIVEHYYPGSEVKEIYQKGAVPSERKKIVGQMVFLRVSTGNCREVAVLMPGVT